MTEKWRWDTGRFHEKPTTSILFNWTISKLIGIGVKVLAQDSIMPRILYRTDRHPSDL
jgi:hypothetical protein